MKKTRFKITLMIFALLLSIAYLTGCSKNTNEATDPTTPNSAEADLTTTDAALSGNLTMYYFDNSLPNEFGTTMFKSRYPDVSLDVVAFDDDDTMKTRIATELASGQGPDVFLYHTANAVDYFHLVQSGSFEPLDAYFGSDPSFIRDNYYASVLDAGVFDEKIYLTPITFTIPYFVTSEERLESQNINLTDSFSFDEFLDVLQNDVASLKNDTTRATLVNYEYMDPINYLVNSSGLNFVDYQNKKANFNSLEFQKINQVASDIYSETSKTQSIMKSIEYDRVGMASSGTFFVDEIGLPLDTMSYHSIYKYGLNEKLRVLLLPQEDNNDSYSAQIHIAMAVNSNSKNKTAGYQLIRSYMDSSMYDVARYLKTYATISVNKSVNDNYLDFLSVTSINIPLGGKYISSDRLPEEYATQIRSALSKITKASLSNIYISRIIDECMAPYYEGSRSYDDCITELNNKVNLYLNE